MDLKMLNITGLSEIIDILKFREKYLIKLKHNDTDDNLYAWKQGVNLSDLNDIMQEDLGFPRIQDQEHQPQHSPESCDSCKMGETLKQVRSDSNKSRFKKTGTQLKLKEDLQIAYQDYDPKRNAVNQSMEEDDSYIESDSD